MARKATKQKHLSPSELVGILSDTIKNVQNGTVAIEEANAISSATRTICSVVKTQMQAYKFNQENPEAKLLK